MEALFMIQNNSVKYEFQGVAEYGAYSPLFLKDAEKFERFVLNYIANICLIFLVSHQILKLDYQMALKESSPKKIWSKYNKVLILVFVDHCGCIQISIAFPEFFCTLKFLF